MITCFFMDKTLSDKLEYGTEPFARTLSGSAVAFAPQSPSLGHLSCICSVCTFGAPIAVPRTLYDLFLASYLKVPRAKALHFLA